MDLPYQELNDTSENQVFLELLRQAEAILTAAQEDEWVYVNEQVINWQQRLYAFFTNNKTPITVEADYRNLQSLRKINNTLIGLAEEARDSAAAQLRAFNLGRKAVHSYGECHKEKMR